LRFTTLMQLIKNKTQLLDFIKDTYKGRIGLVPTMGALHQGHISLIKKSKEENDVTIGSIFVNPIQFNNQTDLIAYPRPEAEDLDLLRKAGCDAVFMPSIEEMYPQKPLIKFNFGALEEVMEGAFRPGHFNGVAIVVSKLFNLIKPTNAYFGLKDYQQVAIITQLVKDLSYPINIIPCDTIRESDGLAMSSRNRRLSPEKLILASKIYQSLQMASSLLFSEEIEKAKQEVVDYYKGLPDFTLEYFEISDAETLQPVKNVKEHKKIVLCIAAYLDGVRLIDNILLIV